MFQLYDKLCGWSRNDTPAQQTLTQLIIHLFMVSAHFLFQPNVGGGASDGFQFEPMSFRLSSSLNW